MNRTRAAVPILALSLLLVACSGGGAATAAPATAAPSASPTSGGGRYDTPVPATPAPTTPPATAAAVNLADSSLGKIIVDGKGITLYAFTADSGASTCYGDCAANWPPLTSGAAPTLGADLKAADFATVRRSDDTQQVTFHGMPLYYFAGDSAPGDTNGQGLSGRWFVVGADGRMIK